MMRLNNISRVKRLMDSAISDLSLDLQGISVLTEAASGAFVVTPLIAALAGAEKVFAVTRNSRYGSAKEVATYVEEWAYTLKVLDRICVTTRPAYEYAHQVQLVTNLGFVRPINAQLVERLPPHSAIALMWETWEYRSEDVDLMACREHGIPVLGTCETHPRLRIFRYVGMLALKLLLEANIEVFRSRILLIGSGHFGLETKEVLVTNGCDVLHIDPKNKWEPQDLLIGEYMRQADAVVLVEHQEKFSLLGGVTGLPLDWFHPNNPIIIHICGHIDNTEIQEHKLCKLPDSEVLPGFMAVTTDYVGPRPVIDLHTAGLKVGEALIRGLQKYTHLDEAIKFALNNSPAMNFAQS